jgi:hypothetical protein
VILAAALLLCVQDVVPVGGRPPLGPPDPEGWQLVDSVYVIVDEQILTRAQLLRDIAQIQGRGGATTAEQLVEARNYILGERIKQKLQVQAGNDLGLDPKVVESSLETYFERRIEEAGGTAELAQSFAESNSTSLRFRELVREELLATTWERIVTGEEAGPGGRVGRDRYVRPGMRLFLYRRLLETPEQWGAFGGHSEELEFQELLIAWDAWGGEAAARQKADDLRQSLVEGADLDQLVEQYGANKKELGRESVERGLVQAIERDDPALAGFLLSAGPGELSPVYSARGGRVRAWGICKLLERTEPEKPDFETLEVQLALEERARELRDVWNRERAMRRLFDAAFVWPPELDPKREEAGAEAEAERLESGR